MSGMSPRASAATWAGAALVPGLLVVALAALSIDGGLPSADSEAWVPVTIAATFPLTGALLATRAAPARIAWLMLCTGAASAVTVTSYAYGRRALVVEPGSLPWGTAMGWLSGWVWTLTAIPVITILLPLFPDGTLPSRRWRPLLGVAALAVAAPATAEMLAPGPLTNFPGTENPLGVEWFGPAVGPLRTIGFAAFVVGTALSICSVVIRWRAADGVGRAQLRSVALAVLVLGAALSWAVPAPSVVSNVVACAATALLPVAIAVAVLRYRLYEIDLLVNRSLVYGSATVVLAVAYFAVVVGTSRYLGSTGASVLATGLVAATFAPLRAWLQVSVDRLLYGLRHDPYTALSALANRIDASADAAEILPAVADAVRAALHVSYVAVAVAGDGEERLDQVRAESGALTASPTERSLVHRGQLVGTLLLGPREGGGWTPADEALLADLTVSAAAAAHSVRLHGALARSRERLVRAQEDERRRLRRDLHDGLGPALTGVVLGVQAARNTARAGGDPDALLEGVEEQARHAIADVRRVVHDLRPPSLDDLGLEAVLRREAGRLQLVGTAVDVRIPDDEVLRQLPAAVEVAALRIATEALTNVARHSGASAAVLALRADGGLHITVEDNGTGLGSGCSPGVGLESMAERARELGGTCQVSTGPRGGTTVSAFLPVDSSAGPR